MKTCDKCGRHVSPQEDAISFERLFILQKSQKDIELTGVELEAHLLFLTSGVKGRHLLPVQEDGKVICEGSPSRAQYLEGQVRDTRTEYPYNLNDETIYRKAYQELLGGARTDEVSLP